MIPGCSSSDLQLCQSVFGERLGLVEEYARILGDEGIVWGLIGPREADRIFERHIVNSLCVVPLIGAGSWVADLGSGAGLPGLPIALARPDCLVDLVEPMLRRVEFLQMCVSRLGLEEQVRVVRASAQEYFGLLRKSGRSGGRGHVGRTQAPDVVTCRAVKSVAGLVDLVHGLVPPGVLLSIKGEKADEEVAAAQSVLSERQLYAEVLHPLVADRVVGTVVRLSA